MLFPCVCRSTFSVNKYEGKGVKGQERIRFICSSSNCFGTVFCRPFMEAVRKGVFAYMDTTLLPFFEIR